MLIQTTNVLGIVIQMSHEVCFKEETPPLGLINPFFVMNEATFQLQVFPFSFTQANMILTIHLNTT